MVYGSSPASSSSRRPPSYSSRAEDDDEDNIPDGQAIGERQPLLLPTPPFRSTRGFTGLDTSGLHLLPASSSSAAAAGGYQAISDDTTALHRERSLLAMGTTQLRKIIWKLETEHEPGLSHTQLLLTNEDLKPGKYTLLSSVVCVSTSLLHCFGRGKLELVG